MSDIRTPDATGVGAETAPASGTIPHARACTLARFWSDPHDLHSPLGRFAMTGEIDQGVIAQLARDLRALEEAVGPGGVAQRHLGAQDEWSAQGQLRELLDYVEHEGARPAVPGWGDLPDERHRTPGDLALPRPYRDGAPHEQRAGAPSGDPATTYEVVGGGPTVDAAVDRFHELVMGDWQLRPYFDGAVTGEPIDMERLKGHQRAFIAAAIGGPDEYTGRDMHEAHRRLGITDDDFGRLMTHLVTALSEAGVPRETIDAIGGRLAPLRNDIVVLTA